MIFSVKKRILFVLLMYGICPLFANDDAPVSAFVEENSQCFECHGKSHYTYYNEAIGRELKEFMCPNRRIDSAEFYSSFHKTFSCFDCHSPDFSTFPHPIEIRGEEPWNCIDCHGYDENYAQYHFEQIDEEFYESVHANVEGFSCWSCHDPHSYKPIARTSHNIKNVVAYANSICLSCHADFDKFRLLSDNLTAEVIENHEWLPKQELHFKNVRCIECHTKAVDTILVAHQIMPKDSAVHICAECHSKDSRLMSTLYKFSMQEKINKYGFINGAVLEGAYVIGANRNILLNRISIAIFLLTLTGMLVHVIYRIIKKRN